MKLFEATKNITRTENGMLSYVSSLNACVDFFLQAGGARGKNVEDIKTLFRKALEEDEEIAVRTLLWARDIREGAGERQIFRDLLPESPLTSRLIAVIPELGRWDDLLALRGTQGWPAALEMIRKGLMEEGNSLCAKWMPRKGEQAAWLRNQLKLTPKQYRKLLVRLTRVVESQMAVGEWDEIDYAKVPSLAFSRYARAFTRHSTERVERFLQEVKEGKSHINATAVYPYDIVKNFLRFLLEEDFEVGFDDSEWIDVYVRYGLSEPSFSFLEGQLMEEQWKSLPDWVDSSVSYLPVVDVSGSMLSCPIGPNLCPMFVAVSLGLYLAERNKGVFKDCLVTFSREPEMIQVRGSLMQRLNQTLSADWGGSTDLEAVFALLLEAAASHQVPQEEMPSAILILSDMQFDRATSGKPAFSMIREKYEAAGYALPRVVFWNLSTRGGNVPALAREDNAALVGGFSASIVKRVLDADVLNPEKIMRDTVMTARYDWR
ncbi:MAG TPA: DUF2828 family protein [Thermotogota bacterium]|nr:DUF2828 family protein [Thermotogota bacterium]HOZ12700.1 DUF2828 family protein [Thermotogota bacterium]HPB87985.1 DUF2828 family protein [Thermotogota bacterium]HPH11338.1 DUF2828 family protein [Thermotogota bacterium]HQN21913.1 DUF2828 family protein [Thermotogota bacterium]